MPVFRAAIAATACLGALPGHVVLAQDRAVAFSVTAGATAQPEYFGADTFRFAPTGRIGFTGLRIGDVQFLDPDGPREFAPGTFYRGALQYIPDRAGRDELAGLSDVDTSVELGLGLQHTRERWQVYGELRYGFIGHQAVSADIGANAIFRGEGGAVLHAGPRIELGNSRFMRTYFGVTDREAARSEFEAFTPNRSVYSTGFEIAAFQPVQADWGLTASVRYDRLRGDAADSPIVQQGSQNQWTVMLGLTRHFNLRF
ncbi:MAG: MipA/OmpV family protein [Roseovarius sp.]